MVSGRDGNAVDDAMQYDISEALAPIVERRAVIEQAKGMLMMIYQLTADAAFDTLRWRSQGANVKLHALAQQVVVEFTALAAQGASRLEYDHALMTLHERFPR